MRIRITKRKDGASTLVCRRADGSECWQKHERRQAAHFPLHDLTHYAAETVLECGAAFFGLVAAGWEFDDTTGKGARGRVPDEAIFVEHLVGLLDVERGTGAHWTADYLHEQLRVAGVPMRQPVADRLTESRLEEIRSVRADLFARWQMLPPDGTLELDFPRPMPGLAPSATENS